MKAVTVAVAALLLMAGTAFAQDQAAMASKPEMHAGSDNVEQHLKDMEQKWTKAAKAGDGDSIMPLLSDDFVNINSDGSVSNRAQTVARTKNSKWEVNEISELQVNAHGNSAIVTGTWTGKGMDGDGKPVDSKERWADTWVKNSSTGKWECVASAAAQIK